MRTAVVVLLLGFANVLVKSDGPLVFGGEVWEHCAEVPRGNLAYQFFSLFFLALS